MASRALAATARAPDDYASVYGRVLSGVSQPAILHWLGPMFDPALAGYWGADDLDAATDACVAVIEAHAAKIDGIKLSLLDAEREIALRRRLPEGVRMYTGDDFNYPSLIASGSDALLGIFDAIAPAAAAAQARSRRATKALRGDPRAHRPAGASPVQRADVVLQDGDRVPGLARRPPGALPDAR